jgi:3-hydroxybutyryl-CoA dehydrogenase
MEISKVGVAGCGLMGHGIAQVSAEAGFDVVVSEISQEALDKGIGKIEKQLARAVEKGKAKQADADAVRARIHPTLELADFADCDLVIEAVTEDLPTKLELWKELDGIVGEEACFATNTSSLPVAEQAAVTGRPGRFLGLHFFNPVQRMPLLEVIAAEATEASTMEAGVGYGERLGKTVVETKDKPGFIVNRLLVPYLLDGIRGYEEGIGSVAEIDVAMKAGAGHPMGPLTLCDVVGLDTLASIAGVMYDAFGEERFQAPATLQKLVSEGNYGVKSGRGFYDYSGEKPVPTDPEV